MSFQQPLNQTKIDQAHKLMKKAYPDFMDDLAFLVAQDRGSFCKKGIDDALMWMEQRAQQLGCSTKIYPSDTRGNTLVASYKGKGKGRFVIFGHMDTVWPEGTAAEWPMRIDGNIATGPGVVDNTGGSLAGIYAIRILNEMGYDRFEEVKFINNGDEEISSYFSKPIFIQESQGMDYAICLESSSFPDEIIGERAGSSNFVIKVYGRGAHCGVSPEEGIDAGLELCHKLIEMKKVHGEDHVLHMSVVKIQAGSDQHSVCDYAEAKVVVRVKTWKEYEMVCRRFQEITDTSYVTGTKATIECSMNHGPMERLPGSDLLSQTIIDVAASIGLELKDVWCGGCADSSFTAEAGVPTVCGVGPLGQKYHTREELLDISTIVPRVTTLVGTLITLTERLNEAVAR